jgi:uncharacterized protein (UPF0332 family)
VTDENRRAAIALELRHAKLAQDAARLLRGAALYNDALSRLYYALFHVATALLLTDGVEPRRHRAMAHLLGAHSAGVLSAAEIAMVSRTATYRDLADYERTWEASAEVADAAFAEVEPLLEKIRGHLIANGWSPPG